jgi:hypothetical protein
MGVALLIFAAMWEGGHVLPQLLTIDQPSLCSRTCYSQPSLFSR